MANFANTKWCKTPNKWLKPWHISTQLKVFCESSPMNTNTSWFRCFPKALRPCSLDESSLRVSENSKILVLSFHIWRQQIAYTYGNHLIMCNIFETSSLIDLCLSCPALNTERELSENPVSYPFKIQLETCVGFANDRELYDGCPITYS